MEDAPEQQKHGRIYKKSDYHAEQLFSSPNKTELGLESTRVIRAGDTEILHAMETPGDGQWKGSGKGVQNNNTFPVSILSS